MVEMDALDDHVRAGELQLPDDLARARQGSVYRTTAGAGPGERDVVAREQYVRGEYASADVDLGVVARQERRDLGVGLGGFREHRARLGVVVAGVVEVRLVGDALPAVQYAALAQRFLLNLDGAPILL